MAMLMAMAIASSILFTALAGIVLLGFIVFIHELGHFLVAKACGVRVLTFSLGFGPRLVGVRFGDTEYRISALPLGGYVRMFGDDITEDIPDEEKRYSFLHKAIPARMAIAAAGPVANFILPVVLFAAFNLGTHQVAAPVVGTVLPSEPAAKAGIRAGDVIRKVDGRAVNDFSDVQAYVTQRPGQSIAFTVERNGAESVIDVTPRGIRGGNPLAMEDEKGRVGIVTSHRLPYVHVSRERAEQTPEIRTGDLVKKVDGVEVASADVFEKVMAERAADAPVTLELERPARLAGTDAPARHTVVLPPRSAPANDGGADDGGADDVGADSRGADDGGADNAPKMTLIQQAVTRDELAFKPTAEAIAKTRALLAADVEKVARLRGLANFEGVVVDVQANTTAAAAGLVPGDRIVSIDGHPLTHSGELSTRLFEAPEAVHVVGVVGGTRLPKAAPTKATADAEDAPKATAPVEAPATKSVEADAAAESPLRIVVFRMLPAPKWGMEDFRIFGVQAASAYGAPPMVDDEVGVGEAFSRAIDQTGALFRDTFLGMAKLLTGQLSLRSMGGPITIFNLAGQAAERGASDFIFLMAFISINLGIVNLLPVPVLDGGHLLLFTIEGIRRKRMSLAAQERLLKIGLGLLAALMILAFFNDIMRLL